MLVLDISNYGGELPASVVADWKTAGVQKVVVGVDLAPGHPMLARRQLKAASDGGLEIEVYRYCYWGADVHASLQLLAAAIAGLPVQRIWLDFEDDSAPHYGVQQELVCGWIADCLAAAEDLWPGMIGVYTARWWWEPYTGNIPRFSSYPLWVAEYDGDPSLNFTRFGGWSACFRKQYWGSSDMCHYTADLNFEEGDMADVATQKQAARTALLQHWAGLIQSGDDALIERAYQEQKYVRALAGQPT